MSTTAIVLKKLRESRNLTIVQLAELAGVGKGTVGDIETGKSKSTIKTLEKLSKALKLTDDERGELFSSFVPKDIGIKILQNPLYRQLDSRGKRQFNDIIEQSALMFNDETISEEDKERVLMAIQSAFFIAKEKNKIKK